MNYHAHIYFNLETRAAAVNVRSQLLDSGVAVGEVFFLRDKPVGPHPLPMFEIHFQQPQYMALIDWLEKHRQGLSVLVHPEQEDEVAGHSTEAIWLGTELELKLSVLENFNPQ